MVSPMGHKMTQEISSQIQKTGSATVSAAAAPRENSPAAASVGAEPPPVTPEQTTAAVETANRLAEGMNPKLRFNYDDKLEMVIVKVLDGKTDEVIRQIPPKEMIALAERLRDLQDKGVLLHEKV